MAEEGEQHVSALSARLDQSQPAVSHHLTLLRLGGLVSYRRDRKHNYYRVESGLICELLEQLFAESGNRRQEIELERGTLTYHRK